MPEPILAGRASPAAPPALRVPGFMTRDDAGGGTRSPSPPPSTDERVAQIARALTTDPGFAELVQRGLSDTDANRITRLEEMLERAGAGSPYPYGGAAGQPTVAQRPEWTRADDGKPWQGGEKVNGGLRLSIPMSTKDLGSPWWFQRAQDAARLVPGHAVATAVPWFDAVYAMNPYRERGVVYENADGAGVVKVTKFDNVDFAKEDNFNENRAKQGNTSSANMEIENYVLEIRMAAPNIQDVPGLLTAIEMQVMQRASALESSVATAMLKASVVAGGAGNAQQVKTGVAATLPTAVNILGKVGEMIESVSAAQRGMNPGWIISTGFEQSIVAAKSSANGEFAFDQAGGVRMIRGFPVHISDHLDPGDTAGDLSALFGGFDAAICGGINNGVDVESNPWTAPGALTTFAAYRLGYELKEGAAVVGLVTGA